MNIKKIGKWFQALIDKLRGKVPNVPPVTPDEPPVTPPVTPPVDTKDRVYVDKTVFKLNGKIFVPVSDTAWTLLTLSKEDIEYYVKMRKSQGFNTVKFGVTEGNSFTNSCSNPSMDHWKKVEWVISLLKDQDMFAEVGVGLIMAYDPITYRPSKELPVSEAYELGKWVGAYLKSYSNIWSYIADGLDSNYAGSDVSKIADGLLSSDPSRLVSYHAKHGYQSTDAIPIGKNHHYVYAQSGHKNLLASNTTNLQSNAPVDAPWYDGEPCYEHLEQYGNTSHIINASDISNVANAGLQRKAGITYGSIRTAVFQSGWKNSMNTDGVKEVIKAAGKIQGGDIVIPPVTPPVTPPEGKPEMQWFERDGHIVFRVLSEVSPKGYSLVTANGHKEIDPKPPMSESQWLSANNNRPPQRIVDGYAEWSLNMSGEEIASAARAYGKSSGQVIMLFCKTNVKSSWSNMMQVSYWINPTRTYGVAGGRAPVRNYDNGGWGVEL